MTVTEQLQTFVDEPVVSPPLYRCSDCEATHRPKRAPCPECGGSVEKVSDTFYSFG